MAIGDGADATAAGMEIPDGTEQLSDVDLLIRATRDYLANGPTYWMTGVSVSIAKGGTGATSAAGARTALGVATAVDAVAAASATAADGVLLEGGTGGRINVGAPTSANNAVTKSYCDGNASTFNGGTITNALTIESNFGVDGTGRIDGRFRNQYARDNVVTGWYNLGVASDGTIGQTASARRYKQHIENLEHTGDIDALRPRRFEWRSGKAPDIGLIAEEVADAGFSDLVTYNSEGTIMGVRHELLPVILLAEVQSLRARVAELEAQ